MTTESSASKCSIGTAGDARPVVHVRISKYNAGIFEVSSETMQRRTSLLYVCLPSEHPCETTPSSENAFIA
jgi:hypothetical protein